MASIEIKKTSIKTKIIGTIIGLSLLLALTLLGLSVAISRGEVVVSFEPAVNPLERSKRLYESGEYMRALRTLEDAKNRATISDSIQIYKINLLEAMILYSIGEYENALTLYQSMLDSDHLEINLYYNIGITCLRLGIADDAIKYLELATALKPSHLNTLVTLGQFYYDRHLYRLSKSYYSRVLDIEYENEEARLHLGLIALKDRNNIDAYSIFSNLIHAENASIGATASALLGDKHLKEDNFEMAEQMYLRSLSYNIKQPNVANNLADLYNEISDYDSIIRIYLQILENDPRNVDALETLGTMHVQKGDYKKALLYYKRLYNASDEPYNASFLIAGASYISQRYVDAEKYYKKVIREDRKGEAHRNSLFHLGEIYNIKHSYKKALVYYKKALEEYKNNALVYNRIGNLYLKNNNDDVGRDYLEKSWSINKNDPSSLLTLAKYYQNKDYNDKAFKIYKEVEVFHPENKEVLFELANIHAENKQYEASKEYLLKISDNKDNPNILRSKAFLMLAEIYSNTDDNRHAIRYYEKSITTKSDSENYFSYGNYLYKLERYDNAALVFQKALEFKPNRMVSSEIGLALGRTYDKMNNLEKAKKAYTYAVKNNRKNIEAVTRLKYIKSQK